VAEGLDVENDPVTPLPHDDVSPTDDESNASLRAKPLGGWFDDYEDGLERIELEIPSNQTDDERTDL
jgi:hypothetical protein